MLSPLLITIYLASLTVYSASAEPIQGFNGTCTVDYDSFGVPTINASNERDLFSCQGYLTAKERIWQLDYNRRMLRGTLASILGPDQAESDAFFRTMQFPALVTQDWATTSPQDKQMIQDYVQGINRAISTLNVNQLAPEYAAYGAPLPSNFTNEDILLSGKYFAAGLSGDAEDEIERYTFLASGLNTTQLGELYTVDDRFPHIYEDNGASCTMDVSGNTTAPTTTTMTSLLQSYAHINQTVAKPKFFKHRFASNNWAFGPKVTKGNKVFVANDPHLDYTLPGTFTLMNLVSPTYTAKGFHAPGIPGIVLGRNNFIAWGYTVTNADVQDVFIMDDNSSGYNYKGDRLKYNVTKETIDIKGGPTLNLNVKTSVYGPAIGENENGNAVCVRWTALDAGDGNMSSLMNIARSTNYNQFLEAVRRMDSLSFNVVYGDTSGNIAMVASGKMPQRVSGDTGGLPKPGNGAFDWIGFYPKESNLIRYNPSSGFVSSTNNIMTTTATVSSLYNFDIGLRALTIKCQVESQGKTVDWETSRKLQGSVHTRLFDYIKPAITALNATGQHEVTWKNNLLNWNANATTTSKEASVFKKWYNCLANVTTPTISMFWDKPDFINLIFVRRPSSSWCPNNDCKAYASTCFKQVINEFMSTGGVPDYGTIFQAHFAHLGPSPSSSWDRSIAVGGDFTTLFDQDADDDALMTATGGPAGRFIADMSTNKLSVVLQSGVSGNPTSSHYDDQNANWAQVKYSEL